VAEPPILRLFSFRPVQSAFDAVMRDVMVPDLRLFPGMLDLYLGRRGPDELGPRLIASIWSSRSAMIPAVGEHFDPPIFHPEYLDSTADRVLEILPLAVSLRFERPEQARIMRALRGRIRPGERDAYIEEARIGTLADDAAGRGPIALHLGTGPGDDDFVTVSIWEKWSDIEAATGGDVERPIATRHPERIIEWDASHFELIEV
jgi:hypothetical protein